MATNFYLKVSIGGGGGGGSVVTSVNGRNGAVTLDKTDVGLNNVDNVSLTAQNLAQSEPTGFPNRTDSTISFNAGTRQFSIAPSVTSFDIWIKGTKYTKSATENLTISTTAGNHYIYFDETGTLQETTTFSVNLFISNAMVSIVYWNSDNNTAPYFADERHGMQMDGATHGYLHTVFGARYLTGLALQGFVPDGTGGFDVNAQFYSDSGTIRDEDILLSIATQSQIPILYREGSLWRKKTADAFPIIYNGTAGYTGTRVPYNQFVTGNWQLTEVTNGDYVLVHFFATNDSNNGVIGILGINKYNNTPSARAAADSEISTLSGLPFAEFTAIGSVIFQTQTSYTNTPKARVVSSDPSISEVYVDFRGEQLYTPSGVATSHSLLSNLSSDDHTQYYNQTRGDARYVQKSGDTMTGPLIVSGSVGTGSAMMRVTNTGTGDCFVVEDSANPDSSNFKIDASGFIYSGSLLSTTGVSGRMQILDSNNSFIECIAGSTRAVSFGASTTGNGFRSSMGNFDVSTSLSSDIITITPAAEDGFGSAITCKSDGSQLLTGINNSSPTEALDVTGKIKASNTITGSNLSGTNTGDETNATIKTKLGVASSTSDGYLTSTDWSSFDTRLPYKGSVSYITAVVANSVPSAIGVATPTITGTASAVTPTVTSYYTSRKILECTASALSSAIAGWRFTAEYVARGGSAGVGGYKFSTTFGFQAGFASGGTNRRFFCGFTSATVAPTDVNPSVLGATQDMFGIGLDNGDANFQIMHATGVANATKVDLGSSFARPTGDKNDFYRLDIHLPPNSGNYSYRVTNLITGAVTSGTISSGVPAAGVLLSPRCWVSAGGVSSAVGVAFEYIYLQSGE